MAKIVCDPEVMMGKPVKVLFNMKGVNWQQAERNVSRGGKISATDWELDLIKQNPHWWGTVEFSNGCFRLQA